MMWWYGNSMGGWGYLFMMVGPLLVGILATGGVVTLVWILRGGTAAAADQILAGRFARGEIDEEDYQRRLDVLRGTAGT